ncbi:peptidase [Streptomyces sp. NBC_01537]|uniref:Clp protease N-terminal domain-containing protein n=1 Tax=Streptomyces sp. NBC_01537 TaxID=2903896 RepID=UPI0038706B72
MDEARLGGELSAVAAGARRRAARDGDRQTDTAHLLHSLLENDVRARAAVGERQLVRVLGYLVQRSIGYGMRWRGSVEEPGPEPETVSVPGPAGSGWSPSAAAAISGAAARARDRGVAQPNGTDLLAALASDPRSRAAEVLRRTGTDPRRLLAGLPDQRPPSPPRPRDVSCYGGDGTVAS